MKSSNLLIFLINPAKWWIPLLIIFSISIGGLYIIGMETYSDAPPISNYYDQDDNKVISKEEILEGQEAFHKYALMDYGTMFGDGALRGPDFTAEALHLYAVYIKEYYLTNLSDSKIHDIDVLVRKEIKTNTYQENNDKIILSAAQVYAFNKLQDYYIDYFKHDEASHVNQISRYITDGNEIKNLAKFFYWGAWVCGVERPGENYSYTHNWPFDVQAGNTPTTSVYLWSILGAFGFIIGLGAVLYVYGQFNSENLPKTKNSPLLTRELVNDFEPSKFQKATYKFFYAAILLFLVQVLAGILTVHDFVGFVNYFGFDISNLFPITISRGWHIQLSLFWISACWVGASVFILPFISPEQSKGQLKLINTIFWLFVLMVAGSVAGIFAGPKGLLGELWYALGNQGWEFVELGKVWQFLLFVIFVLWAVIIFRGVRPVLKWKKPWELPNWLFYCTLCISLLFISGFVATPKTNFVIADFWRWCVIHMWVEAFFEVFTTIIVGYFMVLMGLVNKQSVTKVVFLGVLLFLGSGLLGISHNFYWNAKPVATLALGSVFSTLQVVPLILLTLEAWRFKKMPQIALKANNVKASQQFGLPEVFLFLIGVNFWNFFGAGIFGFIINLPIVNYFEHGTYLTVNHGHAALMGVYGNLSVAAMIFCGKLIIDPALWNKKLVYTSFWSLNLGLGLMVILDLFPAGIHQLIAVFDHGFWYARSNEFMNGTAFQTFTWLRIIGGSVFLIGGVIPLVWLIITRANKTKQFPIVISPAIRASKVAEELGV